MYAAPTAEEDFEILIAFNQKNWKEKFSFVDQLHQQLEAQKEPQKI